MTHTQTGNLRTIGRDLDRMLAEIQPEVDRSMEQLHNLKIDLRPMRVRHRQAGRMLQKTGLKFFQDRKKTGPKGREVSHVFPVA